MLRGITIVVLSAFALVFTRANAFSQDTSRRVLPLSAIDPVLIERGLDSIRTTHQLSQIETRLMIDTAIPRLQQYLKERTIANPRATIIIKNLSVAQQQGCRDCEIIPNQNVVVFVQGNGILLFDAVGHPSESFTFHSTMSYKEPLVIVNDGIQNEKPSFWESTAQPIIVGIGAAAIIALFFLIRS